MEGGTFKEAYTEMDGRAVYRTNTYGTGGAERVLESVYDEIY